MINRGLILTGTGYDLRSFMSLASSKLGLAETPHPTSPVAGHFQTIMMDVIKSGFEPNHFVLRKGIPVKWIVDGKEVTECNKRIVVPKLGLEFDVKEGMQIIEFTPNETGIIPWSCWMGMLHGQFEVVAEPGFTATPPIVAGVENAPPSASMTVPSPPIPTRESSVPEDNAPIPATYQVAVGDTFSKIARKLYGDASKWRAIAGANPQLNAKKLKAGQIVQLPRFPAKDTMDKAQ
jgi:phage tail protein X